MWNAAFDSGTGIGADWREEFQANLQARTWFQDAKFGIFIHWGVYSGPGGEWDGNDLVVKMEDGTIRHFPNVPESAKVIVDGKELKGLVSSRDILLRYISQKEAEQRRMAV